MRPPIIAAIKKRLGGPRKVTIERSFNVATAPGWLQFRQTGNRAQPTSADDQTWTVLPDNQWALIRCNDGQLRLFITAGYSNRLDESRHTVANIGHWHTFLPGGTLSLSQPGPDGDTKAVRYQCIADPNGIPEYWDSGGVVIAPGNTWQIAIKDGTTGNGQYLGVSGLDNSPYEATGVSQTLWATKTYIDPLGSGGGAFFMRVASGESSIPHGGTFPQHARDTIWDFPTFVLGAEHRDTIAWTKHSAEPGGGLSGTTVPVLAETEIGTDGYFDRTQAIRPRMYSADMLADWEIWAYDDKNHARVRVSDKRFVLTMGGVVVAQSAVLSWSSLAKITFGWWNNPANCGVSVNGVKTRGTSQPPFDYATLLENTWNFSSSIGDSQMEGYPDGPHIARMTLGSGPRPIFIGTGNSITAGTGLPSPSTQNWVYLVQQAFGGQAGWGRFINIGVSGRTFVTGAAALGSDFDPHLYSVRPRTILVAFFGTNDLGSSLKTPAQVMTDLQAFVADARGFLLARGFTTANYRIGIVTKISQGGTGVAGRDMDSDLVPALNALERPYVASQSDLFLCDAAMNVHLQPDRPGSRACDDPTYYNGDMIHLVPPGQIELANVIEAATRAVLATEWT